MLLIKKKIRAIAFLMAPLLLKACGTSDPGAPGRCVTSSPSGYVGAASETNQKPWSFQVMPQNIEIQCQNASGSGIAQIVGVVRDGNNLPISSVAVGAVVPEFTGLRLVTNDNIEEITGQFNNVSGSSQRIMASDEFTDNCGVALFSIYFSCPANSGQAVGGSFIAYSGSLFSEAVTITVQLEIPPEIQVIPAPTNPIVPAVPTLVAPTATTFD